MTLFNEFYQSHLMTVTRATLLLIFGIFLARILSENIDKVLKKRMRPHQAMLFRRVIFYVVVLLFLASFIQELGFNISTLLGATGIITVALGIASQTSMSNLISGIFIIGEKPFEIGDSIKVNDVAGEVLSIDFLSVKIRTNDNTMVRIPNETLIKSAISNVSYFPIRRVDLILAITSKENLDRVKTILLEIAEKNPLCLDDPKPTVNVDGFAESGINLQFYCWTNKENYRDLKNSLHGEIKNAFDHHCIETPIPGRTLYLGNPIPVTITNPTS